MEIELSGEEVKLISEILSYSLEACPVESISEEVEITAEKVEELIEKLERALESQ